ATVLFMFYNQLKDHEREEAEVAAQEQAREEEPPEQKVEDLLTSDRIGVEIGYRLIPLVDKQRGGALLERITALRKQLARDHGLLIPPIRITDNIQIPPDSYRVRIYGDTVAQGELMVDRLLAIDGGTVAAPVQGVATKEPAFGLDAVWIEESRREEAEALGYAVTDPASAFITHLTQVLKHNASRLLNREDIRAMLDTLKRECPVLVKEVEDNIKPGKVQRVIALLLEEGVPITNLEKILETVSDHPDREAVPLAEMVRTNLGRAVVAHLLDDQGQQGGGLGIAPGEASALMDRLGAAVQDALGRGHEPVLLTTAQLRRHMRQITQRFLPDLPVVSYSELGADTPVEVLTTVSLEPSDAAT
ncbi:MAG: FHIPEP family type III secretion protein, partial [Planctomycetota bacterium]